MTSASTDAYELNHEHDADFQATAISVGGNTRGIAFLRRSSQLWAVYDMARPTDPPVVCASSDDASEALKRIVAMEGRP